MSYGKHVTRKHGQSASLWNVAIQAGWSDLEVKILKLAVMKFGMGKWTDLYK